MRFKSVLTNPENLFIFGLLAVLIFGSQGVKFGYIFPLVLLNAVVLLIYSILVRGKLIIPKHFDVYLVFIIALTLHTIFCRGQWRYDELFISGGLFWLVFYNLPESIIKKFPNMVFVFGGVMGLIFLYNKLFGIAPDSSFLSLSSLPSATIKHSHIGDLWAVIMVMLFYDMIKRSVWWRWALFIVGIYFLAVSMSRSAHVALITGISYLSYRLGFEKKIRFIFIGLTVFAIVLFVFAGAQKSTFFPGLILSRPCTEFLITPLVWEWVILLMLALVLENCFRVSGLLLCTHTI